MQAHTHTYTFAPARFPPPPRARAVRAPQAITNPHPRTPTPTRTSTLPRAPQASGYASVDSVRHSDHKPVIARLAVPYRAAFRPAAFLAAVEAANAAVARYRGPAWY